MKKNPWLAAILNFLFFGAGTLYVGRRTLVGILVTVGGLAAQTVEIAVSPVGMNAIPSLWPLLLGGIAILKLALAVDGHREARAGS